MADSICRQRRYLKVASVRVKTIAIDTSEAPGLMRNLPLYNYVETVDGFHPRGLIVLNIDWKNNKMQLGWSLTADCDHFNKRKANLIANSRANTYGWHDINTVLNNTADFASTLELPTALNELYNQYTTWLRKRVTEGQPQKVANAIRSAN